MRCQGGPLDRCEVYEKEDEVKVVEHVYRSLLQRPSQTVTHSYTRGKMDDGSEGWIYRGARL